METKDLPQATEGVGVWEHYTLRDGLPDMKIECLFEDSGGRLWIGTHDRGAVCFDGERFDVFTTEDGLAGDGVFSIVEDGEGTLWFGTLNGLTRYDGEEFTLIRSRCGERARFLWARYVDPEGILWFGDNGGSLWCWDGTELELMISIETIGGLDEGIWDIAADTEGTLWLGTGGGSVYRYDGTACEVVVGPGELGTRVWSILPRDDGSLWIGSTGGPAAGLSVYSDGHLEKISIPVADQQVGALLEDPAGCVWLKMSYGLVVCYDEGEFRVVGELAGRLWANLCVDRRGRLWVGTHGHGLYCYDATRFQTFGKAQGLPNDRVNCLAEDEEGILWIGTQTGLTGYDGAGFRILEEDEVMSRWPILSLLADGEKQLWISTFGHLYTHRDGVFDLVVEDTSMKYLTSLASDAEGWIWLGFQFGWTPDQVRHGFTCYQDGQVRGFPREEGEEGPTGVSALLVDRHGRLWAGPTELEQYPGLCRCEEAGKATLVPIEGLTQGTIRALCEDQAGSLWVGTSRGLYRYDGEEFLPFTWADGLSHEIITALTQARDGRLWIGTEGGGVCCYDGEVFQVIELPGGPECNVIYAIHEDRHGQVWLGTWSGLVRYTPQRVAPQVEVERVIADKTYELPIEIEISTTVGRISFCFQGRSRVGRQAHLVYRYRLQGYEEEWRVTRDTQVDYPQLDPGVYGFEVQSVDPDLNYSEPAAVALRITPDQRIAGLTEALRASVGKFVGDSVALRRAQEQLREVAPTDLTVLIMGETGTGKGLSAHTIHDWSERSQGPFIQVNCGAIPEGLVESELFGHEKGAFTGATHRQLGKVELAEGGTLFLDEIGDMPLAAQIKLLHFLEDHTFQRVGGSETLDADVRIITATNRDVGQMVRAGTFREDLYFRLQVFPIRLPSLRERVDDIPLLVKYFAERFARHLDRPDPELSPAALARLGAYSWPGNVRELEHVVQRAVLRCEGNRIEGEDVTIPSESEEELPAEEAFLPLAEQEKRYIERALNATDWVIFGDQGAAQLLDINPHTLRSRIKKYGLHPPE